MTTPDCCPFCGRYVPNPDDALARHTASCSENRNRVSRRGGLPVTPPDPCPYCGKVFARSNGPERHLPTCPKRPAVPLDPCPYCARAFTRPRWRKEHVQSCPKRPDATQVPIGAQPCPYCGRLGFTSHGPRANHMRACDHNPASKAYARAQLTKGHACVFCGRSGFRSDRALRCHIGKCPANPKRQATIAAAPARPAPSETGPCPYCGRVAFKNAHSRTMHTQRCPENPARVPMPLPRPKAQPARPALTPTTPCPFCGEVRAWISTHARGQHVRACRDKHREPTDATPAPARLTCPHCGKGFAYAGNRDNHVTTCPRNPAMVREPRSLRQRAREREESAPLPGGYRCPRCGSVAFAAATHGNHCQKCERDDREAREPGRWRKTIW